MARVIGKDHGIKGPNGKTKALQAGHNGAIAHITLHNT
jgi:hypothetical protein